MSVRLLQEKGMIAHVGEKPLWPYFCHVSLPGPSHLVYTGYDLRLSNSVSVAAQIVVCKL